MELSITYKPLATGIHDEHLRNTSSTAIPMFIRIL